MDDHLRESDAWLRVVQAQAEYDVVLQQIQLNDEEVAPYRTRYLDALVEFEEKRGRPTREHAGSR
jgi:hypothetical protein